MDTSDESSRLELNEGLRVTCRCGCIMHNGRVALHLGVDAATLNLPMWNVREWIYRQQTAGLENAAVEISGEIDLMCGKQSL